MRWQSGTIADHAAGHRVRAAGKGSGEGQRGRAAGRAAASEPRHKGRRGATIFNWRVGGWRGRGGGGRMGGWGAERRAERRGSCEKSMHHTACFTAHRPLHRARCLSLGCPRRRTVRADEHTPTTQPPLQQLLRAACGRPNCTAICLHGFLCERSSTALPWMFTTVNADVWRAGGDMATRRRP